MTLPERMRELAPVLEEADARFRAEFPHRLDELEGGWSAGGLRTFADIWERAEAASA
ncbi:hypothetical protein PROPHIGD91-2_26 [Mycobacterium phage prophiGD91-2]|uniref:hypothetical protein n=1 Tax=Mycobacteroides abscessus TaxID=36809 RepID=UPI00092BA52B|nr:hypothetical protein [Mycobacteroides abscessus]QSM03883.1 hypothetical protein PROPHIGD91-2_26 [Mycobacterium phage prophiGD91-2]QSM90498.1 hypothetical protein I3U44_07455 [Mycobacteroides abscessus subsp. bolletii]QSM90784.1 hypothetical protein I3U44_09100 [Mycobacteroides abscessus subsp. bolletii]SIJ02290.1 Uncharacterised protein [Mycobacteroides abscessus subsp. bolletii]SLD37446.1 Uncharacterised protein [Mycobacteroides abscessus subsp. bolletii]